MIIIPLRFGMKGFMRVQVWRPDYILHRPRIDTGFFPNQILNNGRNNMNTQSSWLNYCRVGTDNTAPTALDTQLGNQKAYTNTVESNTTSTEGSAPYFGWRRKRFRFDVGAGHGGFNLSEAGIGWDTTGSTLISRALIIDPITQLPTTVTPLADEILDVTYELRYYPPLGDSTNSVTLNGVDYDTTTRAVAVTGSRWSDDIGTAIGQYSPNNAAWSAWDGALGDITDASPDGTSAALDNDDQVNESYSANSYQIVMVANCGPTGWNLGAGIRCINIKTTAGEYQTSFSSNPGGSTIPKTTDYTMQMKWVLSWSEYT